MEELLVEFLIGAWRIASAQIELVLFGLLFRRQAVGVFPFGKSNELPAIEIRIQKAYECGK